MTCTQTSEMITIESANKLMDHEIAEHAKTRSQFCEQFRRANVLDAEVALLKRMIADMFLAGFNAGRESMRAEQQSANKDHA